MKSLQVRPLHSHLVRERPKIVLKLYGQLTKFSKSEILHFRKLEQQRKVSKPDETPRAWYNKNQWSYPNQYTTLILMVAGLQKIERRISEHLRNEDIREPPTKNSRRVAKEAARQIRTEDAAEALTHTNLRTTSTMAVDLTTTTRIAPIFLESKRKMEQDSAKPSW
jgi:hypothetical protein